MNGYFVEKTYIYSYKIPLVYCITSSYNFPLFKITVIIMEILNGGCLPPNPQRYLKTAKVKFLDWYFIP